MLCTKGLTEVLWFGLRVVWIIVFNVTSTIFQLYRDSQFYWWRKPDHPEKTIDLSQVTDKLHSIMSSTNKTDYHDIAEILLK
jgi:hypothetical protein